MHTNPINLIRYQVGRQVNTVYSNKMHQTEKWILFNKNNQYMVKENCQRSKKHFAMGDEMVAMDHVICHFCSSHLRPLLILYNASWFHRLSQPYIWPEKELLDSNS